MAKKEPIKLRCKDVWWNPNDSTIAKFLQEGVDAENLSDDQQHLIKELDRRLIQLWDKVTYDRENHSKKSPSLHRPLWRQVLHHILPRPSTKYGYSSKPRWFWKMCYSIRYKWK